MPKRCWHGPFSLASWLFTSKQDNWLVFYRSVSTSVSLSKQWERVLSLCKIFSMNKHRVMRLGPKEPLYVWAVGEVCYGELMLKRMMIINDNLWENIDRGWNVYNKFIWLQYNMAVEKGHCNLMLHTVDLYQRERRVLQKSANANSTWNTIFRLLARMYCGLGDTQGATKYLGNV